MRVKVRAKQFILTLQNMSQKKIMWLKSSTDTQKLPSTILRDHRLLWLEVTAQEVKKVSIFYSNWRKNSMEKWAQVVQLLMQDGLTTTAKSVKQASLFIQKYISLVAFLVKFSISPACKIAASSSQLITILMLLSIRLPTMSLPVPLKKQCQS